MAWATAALIGSAWLTATTTLPGWAATRRSTASPDAQLHLGEGLAAGEAERARPVLHGPPLRQLHELLELRAGPLAEVGLEQAPVDAHLLADGGGDRRRRLPRALERRGVHGGDPVGERGDALGHAPRPAPGRRRTRCRPRARPGSTAPVVGVWPWRTSSTSVRVGAGAFFVRGMRVDEPTVGVVADSLSRGRRAEVVGLPGLPPPRRVAGAGGGREGGPLRATGTTGPGRCPGFGDPAAHLLIVGLAPAAHGANRTGRVFTGDRSGDFLFAALHRCGYANQPTSVSIATTASRSPARSSPPPVKCAPPANKPTPAERDRCRPFLERELALLPSVRVRARPRPVRLGRRVLVARRAAPAALRPRRRGRRSPAAARCSAATT